MQFLGDDIIDLLCVYIKIMMCNNVSHALDVFPWNSCSEHINTFFINLVKQETVHMLMLADNIYRTSEETL